MKYSRPAGTRKIRKKRFYVCISWAFYKDPNFVTRIHATICQAPWQGTLTSSTLESHQKCPRDKVVKKTKFEVFFQIGQKVDKRHIIRSHNNQLDLGALLKDLRFVTTN